MMPAIKRKRSKASDVAILTGIPVTLLHHTGHQNQAVAYLSGWNINAHHIAFQREGNCVIHVVNNDTYHWQKHQPKQEFTNPPTANTLHPKITIIILIIKIMMKIIIAINVTLRVLKIQHGV